MKGPWLLLGGLLVLAVVSWGFAGEPAAPFFVYGAYILAAAGLIVTTQEVLARHRARRERDGR
ncbi:hypothetical protein P0L94_04945 [Microbacter sp. GSS18]|nr:hypothetical protein P0L94_04945 [Microbacter sp. GSS18]